MTGFIVQDLLHLPHEHAQRLYEIRRTSIRSISIDSRTVKRGELFVALPGDRVDGHDFISEAARRGARACVVTERWFTRHERECRRLPLLVVRDALASLGDIAREYRRRFDIPVIGITGSNGKTTTKEMVAAVLRTRYDVLSTAGNLNNQIGLPLTLFRLAPHHRVAVIEMGTNRPGDIEYLCSIARQSHAMITNIGRAHIELLKDRRGIAKEKGAIYRTLPQYGIAFINADEPLLRSAAPSLTKKVTYGTMEDSLVRLQSVTLDAGGCPGLTVTSPRHTKKAITLRLRMPGEHEAFNALAALAVGFVFQCPVSKMVQALEGLSSVERRLRLLRLGDIILLDDSYNANPDSMMAALDTLAAMTVSGKKIAVLGDMLELGTQSRKEHRRIGEYITRKKCDNLLTVGTDARQIMQAAAKRVPARHLASKEALMGVLAGLIQPGDVLLVKGSRGMRMDEVVESLKQLRPAGDRKN